MRLSIVITNYNKGPLLADAVESVCPQLEEGDEIVLVDDASTDDLSRSLIRELASANSQVIPHMKSANTGSSDSKNVGIRCARGEVIVLLDADDVLPSGAVGSIRNAFKRHPEADFVFGDYKLQEMGEQSLQLVRCSKIADGKGYLVPELLIKDWLLLGTSPFRKSVFERVGGFDAMHPRTDDVDFQTKLVLSGAVGVYVDATIYQWNRYPTGNNSDIPWLDLAFSRMRNLELFYKYQPASAFLNRVARTSVKLVLFKMGLVKELRMSDEGPTVSDGPI